MIHDNLQAEEEERERAEKEREEAKTRLQSANKKSKQLITHDNLRFSDMAKAKAIKDGDMLTYDLIEKRLMTKPS